MNRPLPAPARDVALLLARVLLGVVMFAHGYQKMVINGIGRTTEGFESLSIPLAIVSASFVTVVEFAGSVLLVAGALTPVVSALMLIIMGGAAFFVHGANGIFISNGGWELVGVIGAGLLVLAATGPGRFSVDHIVNRRQQAYREALELAGLATPRRPRPAPTPVAGRVTQDLWTPPEGVSAQAHHRAPGHDEVVHAPSLPQRDPRHRGSHSSLPAAR